MTVSEAKSIVIEGVYTDIKLAGIPALINPNSPDLSDPGKFIINGKIARVIHHFSG